MPFHRAIEQVSQIIQYVLTQSYTVETYSYKVLTYFEDMFYFSEKSTLYI